MLASRIGSFDGVRVADLFAGSGALGLEALSRGAAHCSFVEKDRAAIEAIKRNLGTFGAADRADVRSQGVEYAVPPPAPCDLIFLDPPYKTDLKAMALERVCNAGWSAPGGFVSLEHSGERPPLPPRFTIAAERRFGKAHILLLRHAERLS